MFTDDASLGLNADLRPQCEKLPMTNDKTANETADSKPETLLATSSLDFPVVGIGAPAGSVQTLLRLVENMPGDVGSAFVIVLHPSPKHESVAEQVLQWATKMPVIQVTTPTRIEKNRVYLISPSNNLSMEDGHLYFTHVGHLPGRPVTIDLFFRSLTEAHGARAFSVILSGPGNDGSVGIGRIKEFAVSRDEDFICIEVADTRRAIAADFLPRIFDMFSQAEAAERRDRGGLGIGLSLVRQIAEMHGGRIEAEAAGLGKGARFRLWLPGSPVLRGLDYPGEPVDSSALMGLEILLVDDALEALEACRTLLELEGAHVQAEARAKQALAAPTSDDFDLILSDNGMPERQSRHWACFRSASDEAEKLLNAMPTRSAEQRFALLDHQDKTRFFRG